MKKGVLLLLVMLAFNSWGESRYYFRVWLKDKAGSRYSTERPEEFLSPKSIERRVKQGIKVTETDLPVSELYAAEILKLSGREASRSRWLNTIVVESGDSLLPRRLAELPFVKGVEKVFEDNFSGASEGEIMIPQGTPAKGYSKSDYGYALKQTRMLGGDKLHREGFRGDGITIAVLDAGFGSTDRMPEYIDTARIYGTRDFVSPGGDVFSENYHGTNTLSLMLACKKGEFIGSAPYAGYYLLRTEDIRREFPIEEDRWVCGAEYADSIGVDIITSSLGYTSFNGKRVQYTNNNLDGRTALSSRAATIAARTGIIVVNSAGNEGGSDWRKLTFPGDADSILTVGGVDAGMKAAPFSSRGYTADGRVKPDVSALAVSVAFINKDGKVAESDGTSFATPIIAGLTACLWQALPDLTAQQIIELVRRSGSRFLSPDADYGYGVPDFHKAYKSAVKLF